MLYLIENNTRDFYSLGIFTLHQWAIKFRRFDITAFVRNVGNQLPIGLASLSERTETSAIPLRKP